MVFHDSAGGYSIFVMSFGINGLLQSQGDTVSMQRAQIGAFFANIGLNPLLVFGLPGVWGEWVLTALPLPR